MDLFARSLATLVASWTYLAAGSPGAEIRRTAGATVAAFVHAPDREFLNNAVVDPPPPDLDATLGEIEGVYAAHGIGRFAIWAHDSDSATIAGLKGRGYRLDTSTRTMAMPLDSFVPPDPPTVEIVAADPTRFWAIDGPAGLVPELDPAGAHFYVARLGGEEVAMLMAFDHDADCGIYMVGTREAARRRGIATALSAHAVAAARRRGCVTASLQATEMAERVYARVGFRDLGRWLEFVPGARA